MSWTVAVTSTRNARSLARSVESMADERVEQRIAAAFRLIGTLVVDPALIETLPDDVPTVEFVGIGPGHVVECAHLGAVCVELDGRRHV